MESSYPVGILCSFANVSRSAFYKYKNNSNCKSHELDDIIRDIYNKSGKRFGYRRIKMVLNHKYAMIVNHKKIQRIMAENQLKSIIRKKFRFTVEGRKIQPNILQRDFIATKPNQKYATDITYIPTRTKTMYLSTVIDLYDNYPVVWNLSDNQEKSLSIDTIKKLSKIVDLNGTVIHSDQGIHYTNNDYVSLLKELGVKQSMSRKGNCWDNACAESFFSQYKCECIYPNKKRISTPFDVKELTEEYFDFYINYRPQKKLGGMTPKDFRLMNL